MADAKPVNLFRSAYENAIPVDQHQKEEANRL